jgi:hypothetical protein
MSGSGGGLPLIRELVAEGHVRWSSKLTTWLFDGDCRIGDIECCVGNATVCRVKKDETGRAVDGKKYVIEGRGEGGIPYYVAGKIILHEGEQKFFVMTAHENERSDRSGRDDMRRMRGWGRSKHGPPQP